MIEKGDESCVPQERASNHLGIHLQNGTTLISAVYLKSCELYVQASLPALQLLKPTDNSHTQSHRDLRCFRGLLCCVAPPLNASMAAQ